MKKKNNQLLWAFVFVIGFLSAVATIDFSIELAIFCLCVSTISLFVGKLWQYDT